MLTGGRVYKIAQPEPDELLLTIKNNSSQYRLTLSASAALPLAYLTSRNKTSPITAPGFCMLLRKHIQNGRILSITQPGMERILNFRIEHLDEMGDLRTKQLIIELMGKHSNIIFCDENDVIIDSIKHISVMVSSVREVLRERTTSFPIPRTRSIRWKRTGRFSWSASFPARSPASRRSTPPSPACPPPSPMRSATARAGTRICPRRLWRKPADRLCGKPSPP